VVFQGAQIALSSRWIPEVFPWKQSRQCSCTCRRRSPNSRGHAALGSCLSFPCVEYPVPAEAYPTESQASCLRYVNSPSTRMASFALRQSDTLAGGLFHCGPLALPPPRSRPATRISNVTFSNWANPVIFLSWSDTPSRVACQSECYTPAFCSRYSDRCTSIKSLPF
jgi:hypothetical protein